MAFRTVLRDMLAPQMSAQSSLTRILALDRLRCKCAHERAHVHVQDERLRAQRAAERVAAAKALHNEINLRATLLRELRTTSNRGVERAHARLAREHSKANQDMRARRMDALKVGADAGHALLHMYGSRSHQTMHVLPCFSL